MILEMGAGETGIDLVIKESFKKTFSLLQACTSLTEA